MHCPLSAVEEGLWGRSQALEKVVHHFPVTSICICTLMYLLSYNIILMYIQTKNIYDNSQFHPYPCLLCAVGFGKLLKVYRGDLLLHY